MRLALLIATIVALSMSGHSQHAGKTIDAWLSQDRFTAGYAVDETELLLLLNALRSDPRSWRILVDSLIIRWESGRPPRMLQHLLGTEGFSLLSEVRNYLDTVTPASRLRLHDCLGRVALRQARDVAQHPTAPAHNGANGHTLMQRLTTQCEGVGAFGECVDLLSGAASTVILRLLFDPDVPGRGHRASLFEPSFRSVGVGGAPCTNHPVLGNGYVVVLTFADLQ
ncbi:MAG: CAP domain-containing protein [Candidatus Kapabacteria bacterium]|nr:CAP domain-containing protein [Candidatus Kapabacteria bacterium]